MHTEAARPQPKFKILEGDAQLQLAFVKTESIDTVFTSPEPPYNYDQLQKLEKIMLALDRTVKPTGGIWVNLGDVHNSDGILTLIPERFVYDMVVIYGWQLRNSIIWDRNAETFDYEDRRRWRRDHEYCYWFVKDVKQHYWPYTSHEDDEGPEPDVMVSSYQQPRPGVFESGFPIDLIWRTAGQTTPEGGRILDPFCGTGTTGVFALENGYEFLGIEANPKLIPKIKERLNNISY